MCLNYFGRCICFSSLGGTCQGWRTTLAWSMGQTNPVMWSFYHSLSSLNRYIRYQFSPIDIPRGRAHAPTHLSTDGYILQHNHFSQVHLPSMPGDCATARTHEEVWHLISDVIVGGEEAAYASPPDEGQQLISTTTATTHHQYAVYGHF